MFKICRTCLKTIKGECEFINADIPAHNLDKTSTCNKLQNCIPELDLTLIPDPVICTDCITALDVAYNFKKQCLETDDDICAYLRNPNCSYDLTKLLELVQENKEAKNVIIKTEHIECVIEQPIFESHVPCDDQTEHIECVIEQPLFESHVPYDDQTEHIECVIEQPLFESHVPCDDQNEDIKPFNNMEIENEANNQSSFQEIDQQDPNIPAVENDYWTPHHFMDVENNFQCDICLLSFRRRQALIEHQDTHVFKCNICGIVTKTKNGLVLHAKMHTDTRFSCKSCTYGTNSKIAFMTHSRVHTGIKPFTCDKCDRRFTTYVSAENHKKSHVPMYKCPTCGYSSLSGYRLKLHMKIHTGERPFSCPKCDYRAGTKGTLQAHIKTHDNECHLCSFKTKDESILLNHLILHVHKDRPKPENTIKKKEVDGCLEDANVDSNSTNKCDEEKSDVQMEMQTNNTCKSTSDGGRKNQKSKHQLYNTRKGTSDGGRKKQKSKHQLYNTCKGTSEGGRKKQKSKHHLYNTRKGTSDGRRKKQKSKYQL